MPGRQLSSARQARLEEMKRVVLQGAEAHLPAPLRQDAAPSSKLEAASRVLERLVQEANQLRVAKVAEEAKIPRRTTYSSSFVDHSSQREVYRRADTLYDVKQRFDEWLAEVRGDPRRSLAAAAMRASHGETEHKHHFRVWTAEEMANARGESCCLQDKLLAKEIQLRAREKIREAAREARERNGQARTPGRPTARPSARSSAAPPRLEDPEPAAAGTSSSRVHQAPHTVPPAPRRSLVPELKALIGAFRSAEEEAANVDAAADETPAPGEEMVLDSEDELQSEPEVALEDGPCLKQAEHGFWSTVSDASELACSRASTASSSASTALLAEPPRPGSVLKKKCFKESAELPVKASSATARSPKVSRASSLASSRSAVGVGASGGSGPPAASCDRPLQRSQSASHVSAAAAALQAALAAEKAAAAAERAAGAAQRAARAAASAISPVPADSFRSQLHASKPPHARRPEASEIVSRLLAELGRPQTAPSALKTASYMPRPLSASSRGSRPTSAGLRRG